MLELAFDGVRYGWWQKASVRQSVDDLCAAVQLDLTGPGNGEAMSVSANTVASLALDGARVATVRADLLTRDVSEDSHAISFQGRSLGRELVDCQYSKTLSGLKLAEIVKRLCETFKVPVKIDADTHVVPTFSMQCETPANALINAVRAANLLLYPTPDGGLVLTEPSNAPAVATLIEGQHIKHYAITDEFRLRFSEYQVKSFDYSANGPLKGSVSDGGLDFFRPMHIVADRAGQALAGCDNRALLERNRRLARAHRIDLSVPGWAHAGGPWSINSRVGVRIPSEGIDDVFLIGEVGFTLDGRGGKMTRLQCMRREAFLGEEKKISKRKGAKA